MMDCVPNAKDSRKLSLRLMLSVDAVKTGEIINELNTSRDALYKFIINETDVQAWQYCRDLYVDDYIWVKCYRDGSLEISNVFVNSAYCVVDAKDAAQKYLK